MAGKKSLAARIAGEFVRKAPGRAMLYVGLAIVLSIAFMAVFADYIAPYGPNQRTRDRFSPPSWEHPMGTNKLGYDVFSRIVYGSRVILMVVLSAAAIGSFAGVPLGLLSGYLGGRLDRILSMVMDSIYAFPSLILAITVSVMLGPSPINTAIAISVVYIPTYFRMVRGSVISLKASQFVEALQGLGLRRRTILVRHILPNVAPTIMVVLSLNVADAILTEAGLSFLGLSVPPETPDWGFDLRLGKKFFLKGYWWLSFFPGAMIILLAIGFALIGEALAERFSLSREV